jgi:hypothetical protein
MKSSRTQIEKRGSEMNQPRKPISATDAEGDHLSKVKLAASDPMILPRYSYLLAGLPRDARVTIYPDSAHGFLFQHHSRFAADVHAFFREPVDPQEHQA